MSKEIYVLKVVETGEILFSYKTNQGNRKKAFFNSRKHAEDVVKRYFEQESKYPPNGITGEIKIVKVGEVNES